MGDVARLADSCTGRALALSLTPGLDPVLAVAELVDLAMSEPGALEIAGARFRACLRDSPRSECLRLALDLVEEALTFPVPAAVMAPATET